MIRISMKKLNFLFQISKTSQDSPNTNEVRCMDVTQFTIYKSLFIPKIFIFLFLCFRMPIAIYIVSANINAGACKISEHGAQLIKDLRCDLSSPSNQIKYIQMVLTFVQVDPKRLWMAILDKVSLHICMTFFLMLTSFHFNLYLNTIHFRLIFIYNEILLFQSRDKQRPKALNKSNGCNEILICINSPFPREKFRLPSVFSHEK